MADEKQAMWAAALDGKTGKAYWRSFAELLDTPEVREAAEREFPAIAAGPGQLSRRGLMKLLGASMALAGVGGCSPIMDRKIVPYVETPPEVTPGILRYYATSLELDGFATGVLVESHEGRPTKIEGNPEHPASLGATTVFEQASVLGLYDPSRARAFRHGKGPSSWQAFVAQFSGERGDRGAGLRILLQPTGSPLIEDRLRRLQDRYPDARFTFYSPARGTGAARGAELAFGARAQPQYDFTAADIVLSLDADFLDTMPFSTRWSREFAERRRVSSPNDTMNRLYVIEPGVTPMGTMADHRLRRRPSEIPVLAASIAAALLAQPGVHVPALPAAVTAALQPFLTRGSEDDRRFVQAVARDLARHAGRAVVVVGDRQPPAVHALAHVVNAALRSDRAAWTTDPTLIDLGAAEQDLPALADEMRRGAVDTLLVLAVNASYNAPADLEFSRLLAQVPTRVYLGLYEDETAADCTWFIPAAHELESWGDARAYDGTISLMQPLIEPLFGGRTVAEILAVMAGEKTPSARGLLTDLWSTRAGAADFAAFFETALKHGLVADSALAPSARPLAPAALAPELARLASAGATPGDRLEAAFHVDARVYDGRFANNPWLLELPDPTTKLTWDNAAWISPRTAQALGIDSEERLRLELDGRSLEIPALIVAGHADGVVSLPLGYGRRGAEQLAAGVGFDTYRLRTAAAPFFASGVSIQKLGGDKYPLATTQHHFHTRDRPIAFTKSLPLYREDPDFTAEARGPQPSLLPPSFRLPGALAQWAMTIDLSICTGCSACVVACQAENNVLVVGKDNVLKSREMHWLRIDTYYSGSPVSPEVVHQPMLCQHCEKAPCEYVCPVNATVHSPDGLNEMVYNRCVGTRFCSNNCPYKVRRFNWFDWVERHAFNGGLTELQRNPDVTVRERGVMEKCTYCVQRIRRAEIQARIEQRDIRPGEVVTACQQACPTTAIQFGALEHRDTKMVEWREEPRVFSVLHDLGTRPRTQYLARINNPNPELA